jgi:hypothetical protein
MQPSCGGGCLDLYMTRSQLVLAALLGFVAPPTASAQRCDGSHRLNVLFIGNSFTYVQNMPHMVHVIADSLPGPCVDVAMIAIGGATLRDHWRADSAVVRIRQGGWTHVVLNDQSSFGDVFFLNGKARIGGTGGELSEFAANFVDVIRSVGAKPVLLAHWTDAGAPARDQQALDYIFARVANATGAAITPAGRAIATMYKVMPLTPYHRDEHHLSAAGAYLEALTVYETLTGTSPVGAPRSIQGRAVDFQQGIVTDSIGPLVALDASQARAIQLIAQSTVNEAFTPTAPAPITAELSEPTPTNISLSRDSVLGHWRGAAMVLPTPSGDSVRFDLMIGPDSLRLSAGLAFVGTATTAVTDGVVTVSGRVAAPSRRGGGTTEFTVGLRGVAVGNVMSGVISVRQPNGPDAAQFSALGTFTAERVPH